MRRTAAAFFVAMFSLNIATTAFASHSASTAPGSCLPNLRHICVTRSDEGRTVHIHVRDTVKIVLNGSDLTWTNFREIGPQLLRLTGHSTSKGGEFIGTYQALHPGRTTLEAFEAPKCKPNQACPNFILLWQTHLDITK